MPHLNAAIGVHPVTIEGEHCARGAGTRLIEGRAALGAPAPWRDRVADAWTRHAHAPKATILLGLAFLLGVMMVGRGVWARLAVHPSGAWELGFWTVMITYGAVTYAALIWRIGLWWRYKPMPAVGEDRLPSISVIIPAFNEGAPVRQAILSVAASRYPAGAIEIIVVDDGSTDDTWSHILAAADRVRDRVRILTVRQPTNGGKRRALHAGFRRARGEAFVTIDSDSILAPDALRNAVTPLVRDRAVGCVAGCVQVLNPRQSLMTRFLKCTFSLSFKFVRAYQNEFRGVFCTPGALSVYRADVVRRLADEWVNQHFLGRPCKTGEDRAMTNLFLREGWLTAYQGNAVVRCRMPHTYGDLTRMFLRWARSNIRETVFLFGFLFSRFRTRHLQAFRFNMLLVALSLVLPSLLIANSLVLALTTEVNLLRHVGIVLAWAATVSVIYYRNERDGDWVWLFLYWFYWVACLSWIMPYAALTLRNTGWLTRQASKRPKTGGPMPLPRPFPRPARLVPAA